ncbi:hypothetical protein TNCV_397071 [Trichonephila clavipes]|nr:hypothetical protein TNCV_397071 [Trichonephila clavipes]
MALRNNINDLHSMKTAVWAVYFHLPSSNEGPQYGLCPAIINTWCKFQKREAECNESPQKQHLGGKQFADDEGVQHEALLRMTQQPKEFYAAEIGAFPRILINYSHNSWLLRTCLNYYYLQCRDITSKAISFLTSVHRVFEFRSAQLGDIWLIYLNVIDVKREKLLLQEYVWWLRIHNTWIKYS